MKDKAQVSWKSPSNIAFIKYWGKYGNQLPKNPSLSMTLDKCYSETSVTVLERKESDNIEVDFLFEGKENPKFEKRIIEYLTNIQNSLSFITSYKIRIESKNSFPHSTGIASSASAMSALALCLASLEQRYGNKIDVEFYQWASNIARLGSGSASRSVYGEYSVWGQDKRIENSNDSYAVPLNTSLHADFKCMRDVVLIIDSEQKKVSSSAGHGLMENHPYAEKRFENARNNLREILSTMQSGDFEKFAHFIEHEALSLHAMMMTAKPWYTLLAPNTIATIERIKHFRQETNTKICFTLDAGPNIHLLFPGEENEKIKDFISNDLVKYCSKERYIVDNIGTGPELLNEEFS